MSSKLSDTLRPHPSLAGGYGRTGAGAWAVPSLAVLVAAVLFGTGGAGCSGSRGGAGRDSPSLTTSLAVAASPNRDLLDEINRAGTWFHARKTRPIWVRRLVKDEKIATMEGVLQGKAGDFVCRGEQGEFWPQSANEVERKYVATDQIKGGWQRYDPRPDAEGIMAAPVPHAFEVQATWGRLAGKAGDFVAKNFRDRAVDYPADVWIVDRALFRRTYEAVTNTP